MSVNSIDTLSVGQPAQGLVRPKPASPEATTGPNARAADSGPHAKGTTPSDVPDTALTSQDNQSAQASLENQIRAAREQLNDWVTCVSATTPKGQAEIRSLSTQISAAQEQINRLPQAAAATASSSSLDLWA